MLKLDMNLFAIVLSGVTNLMNLREKPDLTFEQIYHTRIMSN